MFSLFNFSSIFPGGSADPICPYVRTPMPSPQEWSGERCKLPSWICGISPSQLFLWCRKSQLQFLHFSRIFVRVQASDQDPQDRRRSYRQPKWLSQPVRACPCTEREFRIPTCQLIIFQNAQNWFRRFWTVHRVSNIHSVYSRHR